MSARSKSPGRVTSSGESPSDVSEVRVSENHVRVAMILVACLGFMWFHDCVMWMWYCSGFDWQWECPDSIGGQWYALIRFLLFTVVIVFVAKIQHNLMNKFDSDTRKKVDGVRKEIFDDKGARKEIVVKEIVDPAALVGQMMQNKGWVVFLSVAHWAAEQNAWPFEKSPQTVLANDFLMAVCSKILLAASFCWAVQMDSRADYVFCVCLLFADSPIFAGIFAGNITCFYCAGVLKAVANRVIADFVTVTETEEWLTQLVQEWFEKVRKRGAIRNRGEVSTYAFVRMHESVRNNVKTKEHVTRQDDAVELTQKIFDAEFKHRGVFNLGKTDNHSWVRSVLGQDKAGITLPLTNYHLKHDQLLIGFVVADRFLELIYAACYYYGWLVYEYLGFLRMLMVLIMMFAEYRAVYNANTQLYRYFCVHSEIRSLFSKATNTQSMLLVLLSKRSLSPPDKDEVSDKLMSKDDKDCGVYTAVTLPSHTGNVVCRNCIATHYRLPLSNNPQVCNEGKVTVGWVKNAQDRICSTCGEDCRIRSVERSCIYMEAKHGENRFIATRVTNNSKEFTSDDRVTPTTLEEFMFNLLALGITEANVLEHWPDLDYDRLA